MRLPLPLVVLSLLLAADVSAAPSPALQPIFNGVDLAGWKVPSPNPFWRVEGRRLIGENDAALTGSMLWTEKSYGDFVLEFEARWTGEIDSGVMLRKPELQLQIGVSRSLKRDLTGSFYTGGSVRYPEAGQVKGVEGMLKPGDWNHFRLEARGTTFSVSINGKPAVTYSDSKYAEPAPLGLQIHGKLAMKVEFRNLRAASLAP
jgi:hypothetical protein